MEFLAVLTNRFICRFIRFNSQSACFTLISFPAAPSLAKFASSITSKHHYMEHRIQLSTALLITVRSGNKKTVTTRLRPAGIKIATIIVTEKSLHAVDAQGNIITATLQEEFAA